MSDISHLIEPMYGHHYTPQTISNMTKAITEEVDAFRQRALSKRYVCVYLDATFLPVKRETVSKEAVYIAVGIRKDGSKEVLLFISDGLTGIKDSIHSVFPKARYQTCFIHVERNISHKVRVSDRKEICEDLKTLYRADGKEKAEQPLDAFVAQWRKSYSKVTQSLKANQDLFTFYDFPQAIRRSIYSTNLIESFNKQIKRYSKRKEQFPNVDSLDRFLVTQFEAYNQRFATRCHIVFDQARAELAEIFNQ